MLAKATGAWKISNFRAYAATLVDAMSWRVALALALMVCQSVTQGAQLLLLVPLMQLVGLDVQQGSVGWLADLVASVFAVVGVPPTLITVLGAFMLFTCGLALLTRWQTVYNFKLQQDFVALLRRRLYRSIVNTDWLAFTRSRSSDFTHALTTELDRVGNATSFLLRLVTDIALACVFILFTLRVSPTMTALVLVCGAGLLVLLKKQTRAARFAGEDISLATNGLYAAAIEHLGSMKTTKSYGLEERNADIFARLAGRVSRMQIGAVLNRAGTTFWFNVGSAALLVLILFVSVEILGTPTADLLLLIFLFYRTMPLLNQAQQSYQQFLNAMPAFAGVMALQARCEASAESRAEHRETITLQRNIRLEGVSFAYEGEDAPPAITTLDLTVRAGETTAIIGPSGAGKSTVADLIMGLILPDRGQLLVDGVPLRAELLRSWRGQIGYVAQDTFLFHDTVRANLLWACPNATDEAIRAALRSAAADDFVFELPDGVDTVLGDRGVRLSGGERQRLALARALLRRPSLLILDEATSALDSENEKRIQEAIDQLHGRMTILIITHRISTIRDADVIHVLERGFLVQTGDWGTLVSKEEGRFRVMYAAQTLSSKHAPTNW